MKLSKPQYALCDSCLLSIHYDNDVKMNEKSYNVVHRKKWTKEPHLVDFHLQVAVVVVVAVIDDIVRICV